MKYIIFLAAIASVSCVTTTTTEIKPDGTQVTTTTKVSDPATVSAISKAVSDALAIAAAEKALEAQSGK